VSKRRNRTVVFTLLLVLASLVYGLLAKQSAQAPSNAGTKQQASIVAPGYYSVAYFTDGDTLSVNMDGHEERVRFIGVDTPETKKPSSPVQCFGHEASDFTKNTIGSQSLRLEADKIGNNRDRYNRLLRYVYLPDGTLLNEKLIQQGYGFAYLSFPFSKQADFAADQAAAQDARKGLWAVCTPKLNGGRWQSNNL
jgi:micrococcal nuclease